MQVLGQVEDPQNLQQAGTQAAGGGTQRLAATTHLSSPPLRLLCLQLFRKRRESRSGCPMHMRESSFPWFLFLWPDQQMRESENAPLLLAGPGLGEHPLSWAHQQHQTHWGLAIGPGSGRLGPTHPSSLGAPRSQEQQGQQMREQ